MEKNLKIGLKILAWDQSLKSFIGQYTIIRVTKKYAFSNTLKFYKKIYPDGEVKLVNSIFSSITYYISNNERFKKYINYLLKKHVKSLNPYELSDIEIKKLAGYIKLNFPKWWQNEKR